MFKTFKKDQIFDIGCGLSVFLYELKKLQSIWPRARQISLNILKI